MTSKADREFDAVDVVVYREHIRDGHAWDPTSERAGIDSLGRRNMRSRENATVWRCRHWGVCDASAVVRDDAIARLIEEATS